MTVLLLVGIGLLAPAAQARASRLRVLTPSVVRFAADGSRYVAWQVHTNAPIVVLDTQTGIRRAIPMSGCVLADQLRTGVSDSGGRFLISCSNTPEPEQRLLDAGTGTSTPLPAGNTSTHLSAPSERVCPALRHSMLAQLRHGVLAEQLAYHTGAFAHVTYDYRNVRLERCNGHSTLLPGPSEPAEPGLRPSEPRSFDLGAGLFTWDTAHPASGAEMNEQSNAHGTLSSYRLSTHRRETWKLPRLSIRGGTELESPGVYGYSTHTANTVFWIASRTVSPNAPTPALTVETSTIYAARSLE